MYDRTGFPAPGMLGGGDGEAGSVGTASGEQLHPKRQQLIPAGERVILKLPGGGGYGDPLERDPELVRRDVEDGLISPAHAREAYGVVLAGDEGGLLVDEEATERLRAEADGDRRISWCMRVPRRRVMKEYRGSPNGCVYAKET